MHRKVDIVIVSLYRWEKTVKCVESLLFNCDKDLFNIIIIDNGSDEFTVSWLVLLGASHSNVKVIYNKENIYIGGARKQALQYCKGEYVLYLDNDMEVEKDFVKYLIKGIERSETVAVSGSKVIKDGKVQLCGRAITVDYDGVKHIDYSFDNCDLDNDVANVEHCVSMIHGGATLFRRSVLDSIEFDPFYTIGYEDMDIIMQITEKGHRIVFCPDAVCNHYPDFTGEYGKIRRNSELIGKCRQHFQDKWRIRT